MAAAAPAPHPVVNGTDISATWKRRPDKYDFEIEDVIAAQGFDGKPRVVSREEFDAAVKAANGGKGFIAQRTYSAHDQETLDAYRDQLYRGKWYVDCSNGGAHYGQGMYCAADYSGVLTDDIKKEMRYYGAETRKFANVETFTVTPGAKVISYEELHDMQMDSEALSKKVIEDIFEKYGVTNEDQKMFISSRSGIYFEDTSATKNWFNSLSKEEKQNANALARSISREVSKKVDSLQHLDIGAFGALHGYDIIIAEKGMHTVILNRTKVIFLQGEY